MIAARLAGGNLFFCLFWVGDFWVGIFGSTRSSSEHSDFFEGICGGGIFLGGWGVGGFFFCVGGVFWIVSVGKN